MLKVKQSTYMKKIEIVLHTYDGSFVFIYESILIADSVLIIAYGNCCMKYHITFINFMFVVHGTVKRHPIIFPTVHFKCIFIQYNYNKSIL